MSNLQIVYNKVLALLHKIEDKNNFVPQRRKPKLSDKGLLALSLAAESLGIDSEHFLKVVIYFIMHHGYQNSYLIIKVDDFPIDIEYLACDDHVALSEVICKKRTTRHSSLN